MTIFVFLLLSFYVIKAIVSQCKSYRITTWKLSLLRSKAIKSPLWCLFSRLFPSNSLCFAFFCGSFSEAQMTKMSYSNVTSTEYTDCTFFWTRITQITRMFSHRLHRFTQIFSWTTDCTDCTDFTDIFLNNWLRIVLITQIHIFIPYFCP